jgi:benzoyl-CoA reductase/2-hydroxyglutaryl-CoA dehydratase subunit BcrC/BadD/HgdB
MKVVCASPWVPVEWIAAHGFDPGGIWFAPDHRITSAGEGVCAFAQRAVDLAKAHPETAVIFTTACDQMRRAADTAASDGVSRVFLFNLPATWQTPSVRRLYLAEVQRVGRFLERFGGRRPTPEKMVEVIRDYEERRVQLRAVFANGTARQGVEALAQFYGNGTPPRCASPTPPRGVPLALVGGPLLPAQWRLFDAIEAAGARVVVNASEPGERHLLPPLSAAAEASDPLAALADAYFDNCIDVFQRPNTRLYAWLASRLSERRVRGIVLWAYVGCDLWRAEAASLREAFGLPVLLLDAPDARGGGLRDPNRLQAFAESLQ